MIEGTMEAKRAGYKPTNLDLLKDILKKKEIYYIEKQKIENSLKHILKDIFEKEGSEVKQIRDIFKFMFDKGGDINRFFDGKKTPLFYYIEKLEISVIHFLLYMGANPNAMQYIDGKNITPLIYVRNIPLTSETEKEKVNKIVDLLLYYGADSTWRR